MNEVNLSIQGHAVTIMDAAEKTTSFFCQAATLEEETGGGQLKNFLMLEEVLF